MPSDVERVQSSAAILSLINPASQATAIAKHPQRGKPAIRLKFAPGIHGFAWTHWGRAWTQQTAEAPLEVWLQQNGILSVPVRSERVTTTGELAVVVASTCLISCLTLTQADQQNPADDLVRQEAASIATKILDEFASLARGEDDLGPWVRKLAFQISIWGDIALTNAGYERR